ncbi:MAG: alpha/beta hydrolase [Planctomycetaceae bacterium]|nr:alpha/beta hydrolase [Planctomycetaceae bacterium]
MISRSVLMAIWHAMLALSLVGAREAAHGQPPLPAANFANVSYGPHERHTLDVWQAKADGPTPLVIFIHGGGWHGGDKWDVPAKLLRAMLDRGVSVASINYRYTSIAKLPGPQLDAVRAVQFLRTKSAEWKLNPERFAAYGISAGGCSALWLAYHADLADPQSGDPVARASSRLQAAVGLSPQTSLEPEVITGWLGAEVLNHPMVARAVGAKDRAEVLARSAEWCDLLREASPINHVSRDDPPVLVAYPTFAELPATNPSNGIHHALFGVKLKERADAAGCPCIVRIEDRLTGPTPKPEEFLIKHLTAER